MSLSPLPAEALSFLSREGVRPEGVSRLPGDGSARTFLRLHLGRGTLVLILPRPGEEGRREARSYALIGSFLRARGIPVPAIHAHDPEGGFLLVEDLGDRRLEDATGRERDRLYHRVIEILVAFQGEARGFDPGWALEGPRYDATLMWEKEALYFLSSFVREHLKAEPPPGLEEELRGLWREAAGFLGEEVLLHRDFQSRNVMIPGGRPHLIDFQGARLGPPAYDLASLLFDPYVSLSPAERETWFRLYLSLSGRRELAGYHHFALFRLLQALGAFARLSRAGKTWFARHIPRAAKTLKELLDRHFPRAQGLRRLLDGV